MNAIFTAAKEVCDFMKKRRWKFCVIGGLAVQRWGELKETPEIVTQARRILEGKR